MQTQQPCNIAAFLGVMARLDPHGPAIFAPAGRDAHGHTRYVHHTRLQLDQRSDAIARGLQSVGIGRGTRVVVMVRPGLELFALTFALFKAGAVPVMVDPGIGRKNLGVCLAEAGPEAFIGIPPAHLARLVLGWGKRTVRKLITVGPRWLWGGWNLKEIERLGQEAGDWKMVDTAAEDVAAILFTSGATGVPKGVIYSHGTFIAQVELIRDAFAIEPGEIDLPTFPLFGLFDPALGMTTVIPEMDFTRPAQVDPRRILAAVEAFGVTNMFGSPALLDTVGRWGAQRGVRMPTLRRVISAGAPVPAVVMERYLGLLEPGALIWTPYGATEALPVAITHSDELLGEARGRTDRGEGVCVGRPLAANDVRIIAIDDGPIATWSEASELPQGQIGEITVTGPTVTGSYHNRPESTALAKIDHDGQVRHRMGDVGYMDAQGRLWFCGRKSHRVVLDERTLFTVPCERVFEVHPKVRRTALVGARVAGRSAPLPTLCVEWEPGVEAAARQRAIAELSEIGAGFEHTRTIATFVSHPGFPVDIRHNAKIDRPLLARWASMQPAVKAHPTTPLGGDGAIP